MGAAAPVDWAFFEDVRADLAEPGRRLLYAFGVGLAYLSTVRPDGGPRVHPVCPVVADGGLFAFLIASPKAGDLRRDPRFALHSFPMEDNEDAFYVTGAAYEVTDPERRSSLEGRYLEERPHMPGLQLSDQSLFGFRIATALLTLTSGHGDPAPRHEIWRA
jgi:pyridoxamine 5'-phosphate oxidase-like protein